MEHPELKHDNKTQEFIKKLYKHDLTLEETGHVDDSSPRITILDDCEVKFTDFEKEEIKALEEKLLDDLYIILGSPWRESMAKYMTVLALPQLTLMRIVGTRRFRFKTSKGLVFVDVGEQRDEDAIEWELI